MKIILALLVLFVVYVHGARFTLLSPNDVPEDLLCNYFAANSDLTNAGVDRAISTFCNQQLGATPNSIVVNADTYPYKMCLAAGEATFGNLQPVTGQSIIAKDFFNNTSDQTVTHSFALSGNFQQSISIATTQTVTLSETVGYSVTIPEVLSTTFSVSTSFSSSTTQTNSATSTINYNPQTSAECDPKCSYTASESVTLSIFKSDMSVPICLSGYARCTYNSRVQGHYYWYVLIDDFISPSDRCFTQMGTLSSVVSDVNSQTTFSKGCY
jgi:hypothetical protein